jgi:uncharacterized protein YdgA (DUF945 family)
MKRILIVVVLFVLLVAAPWGIGRIAAQRVDEGLDRLVATAPYLSIVERKYSAGWFRSQQEVTFAVLAPWTAAVAAAMGEANEGVDVTAADPSAPAAPPAPETPASPPVPLRFTVRNEILHGPVLWTAGFGIAHVKSRIVWSDTTRARLVEWFGDDEPFEVSTRIGFTGGGTTTLSGDGRTVKNAAEKSEVSYDDFRLRVGYSRDADEFDVDGKWPRIELKDANGGTLVMRDIKLDGEAERLTGDLYDSDAEFAIEELHIVDAMQQVTDIEDIRYGFDTETHGDFLDMAVTSGTGPLKTKNFELTEVHYDFTLRRLHTATLAKLVTALKESYTRPVTTVADVQAAITAPYQEHGVALFQHDPEFAIDRISIATAEGEGVIKGLVKFKGVTAADFAMGALSLIPKVDASFDIKVSEAMLAKLSGNANAAAMAVDGGYATRQDGHLVSKLEFRAGELLINGKSQGIPGLGASPPEAGPEGMAPEAMPEE